MSLLMLFVLTSLIEYEVEHSSECAIMTVVTENGVHRDLRDDPKNNRWSME